MNARLVFVAVLAATMTVAVAGSFDIAWHTIDSGGVMRSTGGDLELSGTIGQPDAGRLSGGDLELSGGFWFERAPADCNEDGGVNLFDHFSFVECLAGPDAGVLTGCDCFDVNASGAVDLRDFAAAQLVHSGS